MTGTHWGLGLTLVLILSACGESRRLGDGTLDGQDSIYASEWKLEHRSAETDFPPASPFALERLDPRSVIFENNRSFTDLQGQEYQIRIRCFYLKEAVPVTYLASKGNCHFDVIQEQLYNTNLTISVFRNRKLLFDRIITKDQLESVIDRRFLKKNVTTGADLFAFNEAYRHFVFLVSLAQRVGGTEWYAQIYQVYDESGRLTAMGLVDYPYHCEQMIGLSQNNHHLITCSEMFSFATGKRHQFQTGDVVLSRFLNDTAYAVIYDLRRDSLICDTLIYFQNDTLYAAEQISVRDTLTANAYIFHTNGDTLATFNFQGFSQGLESYLTEVKQCQKLPAVLFLDRKRKRVQVIDLAARMKRQSFPLNKLPILKSSSTAAVESIEFSGLNQTQGPIWFHLGAQNEVLGYSVKSY
jgi:hypothetical protein